MTEALSLTDCERAVVDSMREHYGKFGEMRIVFSPDTVDVQEGKRRRFKIKP